jgi:hypothetical protein
MGKNNEFADALQGALIIGAIIWGVIWWATDSPILGLVFAIAIIILTIAGYLKGEPNKGDRGTITITATKVLKDEDIEFHTRIAGITFYNTIDDIGGFVGYVELDPDNEYDKNAIAIYNNDGKLVGHLPKTDTRKFRNWTYAEKLPCIGYITEGDDVEIYGKIKIINADAKRTQVEIAKYAKWLIRNFGVEYVPADFDVGLPQKPQTEEEWLDVIDRFIVDNE